MIVSVQFLQRTLDFRREDGMATGADMQKTGQAGEHYVAAELCRRRAYAVTFSGNIPNFDIIASNREQTRAVQIQVYLPLRNHQNLN